MESKKQLREADKIVMVFDNSKPIEKEDKELIEFIDTLELQKTDNTDNKTSIFPVFNKVDLPSKLESETLVGKTFEPIWQVSALNSDGLSTLEDALISEFKEFTNYTPKRPIIFTKRQQEYLSDALNTSTQCLQVVKEEKELNLYVNLLYVNLLSEIKQNLLNCMSNENRKIS